MDRAEALKFAEELRDKHSYRLECAVRVPARSYQEKIWEMLNYAIAALREQEQKEHNGPLTLKDLRKMNGEPVWIAEGKFWALVLVRPYNVALICNDGETVNAEGWIKHMGPVYRYKPGGVEE